MPHASERPKPFLFPEFCKGCGRCNACGLCMDACPEPYGLMPRPADATDLELEDPHRLL